jgi:tetratricopeptide (TPR) repeat protein
MGDEWDKATALVHLANASLGIGEYEQARTWLNLAWASIPRLGDPWLVAFNRNNFGEVARAQGDYELARGYYEEAEDYFRRADAVGDQARLIHTRAYLALHDGNAPRAETLFHESLAAFRKLGNKRGMAECLAGLAAVGIAAGKAEWAATLLSAAEAQMASSGAAWWPADRVEIERTRGKLRQALGEEKLTALWEWGQAMSLEEALNAAVDSAAPT